MSTTTTSSLRASAPPQDTLYFHAGIPGFPRAKAFSLRPWGNEPTPFKVLECQDVPGLCFVTVDPAIFFPDYEPRFGAEVYQALDADRDDRVDVLVILTLHSKPEDTTANLLGPVVVNPGTGRAVQAVLSGSGFGPQTPIVKKP
jgi:flagellar assembly factor FliW